MTGVTSFSGHQDEIKIGGFHIAGTVVMNESALPTVDANSEDDLLNRLAVALQSLRRQLRQHVAVEGPAEGGDCNARDCPTPDPMIRVAIFELALELLA